MPLDMGLLPEDGWASEASLPTEALQVVAEGDGLRVKIIIQR